MNVGDEGKGKASFSVVFHSHLLVAYPYYFPPYLVTPFSPSSQSLHPSLYPSSHYISLRSSPALPYLSHILQISLTLQHPLPPSLSPAIPLLFSHSLPSSPLQYSAMDLNIYSGLSKFVFLVFTIMLPIMLLNMLIAMMANTYSTVISMSEKEWVKAVSTDVTVFGVSSCIGSNCVGFCQCREYWTDCVYC